MQHASVASGSFSGELRLFVEDTVRKNGGWRMLNRVAQTAFILFSTFLDSRPVSAASDLQPWIYGGLEILISNSKTPV
jgi:hypothetical protein